MTGMVIYTYDKEGQPLETIKQSSSKPIKPITAASVGYHAGGRRR